MQTHQEYLLHSERRLAKTGNGLVFCNLERVGSSSLGIFSYFCENRNAQGQAVSDFSGPANHVYCSQTFVFAETSSQSVTSPRNSYPALIVNIEQVGG